MKKIGAKRGSNLLYCVILVALLGLLAGGYSLLLSYNTNASVAQRRFQQCYLEADSIRQSIVDSILQGNNPLIQQMSDEIKAEVEHYKEYKEEYDAAETDNDREELREQNLGMDPDEYLQSVKDKYRSYSATSQLSDGTEVWVTSTYSVSTRQLSFTMRYQGTESYTLAALMESSTVSEGDSNILLAPSSQYPTVPTGCKQVTLKKNDIKKVLIPSIAAQTGDVWYTITNSGGGNGSLTIDVHDITLPDTGRVFIEVSEGMNIQLMGQMVEHTDWSSRLFIISRSSKITLQNGLVFYGQIFQPQATLLTNSTNITINGGLIVSESNKLRDFPAITVINTQFSAIYADLGVDTGEWQSWDSRPIQDPLDELSKLMNWKVKIYYEG